MQIIYYLLIAAVVSGCTMTDKYQRPDLPVTDNIQTNPYSLADNTTQNTADIGWHDFFQDDALKQIINLGLINNRDLKSASLNVEAAKYLYRVERADMFPSLDGRLIASRQKISKAASSDNESYIDSSYQANLASISYEVDLFGRLRNKNEIALQEYFATASARSALKLSLIAEIANSYYQLLADKELLDLAEQILTIQNSSLDLILENRKNGLASDLDVETARTNSLMARSNKLLYEKYVEQDKNALLLLLGTKDLPKFLNNKQLRDIEITSSFIGNIPSSVLFARPDIMQAEHKLKAANADIGIARAAFFPTLQITSNIGFSSNELNNLFSSAASGSWSFIPQITLPIFRAGENKARLNYSKTQKEIMLSSYEKVIQTAFKEVKDELAIYQNLQAEYEIQNSLVNSAQNSYNLTNDRYLNGIDNLLNLYAKQQNFCLAKQNKIKTEKLYLTNITNLYKALGGGRKETTK